MKIIIFILKFKYWQKCFSYFQLKIMNEKKLKFIILILRLMSKNIKY